MSQQNENRSGAYTSNEAAAKLKWDEVVRGLGLVCIEFQMLESLLKAAINDLVVKDNDPLMGDIITAELSFEGLMDLLYAAWKYRHGGSPNVAPLAKILKRCAKAKVKRNQLLHSEWYRDQKDGEGAIRVKMSHRGRKGFRIKNEKITPAIMNEVAEELRRCRHELAKFLFDLRKKTIGTGDAN